MLGKNNESIERKIFHYEISETKTTEIDGKQYGVIKGYASTFGNVDRGMDVIDKGAFSKSLARYQKENRQIRMHFQHYPAEIIGGWPIDRAKEDEKGLYLEGNINLDVQRGKEAFALAKQGVLTDLSIGFSVQEAVLEKVGSDTIIRHLKEIDLWEASMVSEPMNQEAQILSVKGATSFQDLSLADRDRSWDKSSAIKRVRAFTKSEDAPSASYKRAFMWFDSENADNFTAYKLPYADVVDGKLVAIPRAIFAIAQVLRGARGGVDIPVADKKKVESHVNRYYDKMGLDSPLKSKQITVDLIEILSSKKDLENILSESGVFSKQAATYLSSFFIPKQSESVKGEYANEIYKVLGQVRNLMKQWEA